MASFGDERDRRVAVTSGGAGDRARVAEMLARLSAAWQGRRYDELATLFDEQVVFTLPGFTGRLQGRELIVESYRKFMERATLTEYHEDAPSIDVWGSTAVASYRWEMEWFSGGVPNHGAGHDVFVLHRGERDAAGAGEWHAVWRTMTFEPAPS